MLLAKMHSPFVHSLRCAKMICVVAIRSCAFFGVCDFGCTHFFILEECKMKRITVLLLALCLICCLCSCDASHDSSRDRGNLASDQNDDEQGNNYVTEESINGREIEYALPYSEGLMFLKLTDDDDHIYCVNKNGNVAFKLDDSIVNVVSSKFMGEYAFVSVKNETGGLYHTALCDKKGQLTSPSDVGATKFYGPEEILKAGYVLAVREEDSYDSTKRELGVLNTKWEWEVPLSEELYNKLEGALTDAYKENFVVGNVFYSVALSKSLNLKTGEVRTADMKKVTPSSEWGVPRNCEAYYRVKSNTIVPEDGKYVDLRGKNIAVASRFVNGKAGVLYHNEDANKYYVSVIDEKGTNQFEPTEITYAPLLFQIVTDGEYLASIEAGVVVVRDLSGNKMGEFSLDGFRNAEIGISNGVVIVSGEKGGEKVAVCLDAQLNRLF